MFCVKVRFGSVCFLTFFLFVFFHVLTFPCSLWEE